MAHCITVQVGTPLIEMNEMGLTNLATASFKYGIQTTSAKYKAFRNEFAVTTLY